MTLRWRITMVTVALVALAAGVVAIFAYTTAKRIQYETLDAGLLAASGQVSPRALERGGTRLSLSTYQPYAIALLKPMDETTTLLLPAGNIDQPLSFPPVSRTDAQARVNTFSMLPGEPAYRAIIRPSGPRRALLIVEVVLGRGAVLVDAFGGEEGHEVEAQAMLGSSHAGEI
ncbi:MAG: hypothetical protein ACKN9D_11030, partial [Actinomycetales bacterium]